MPIGVHTRIRPPKNNGYCHRNNEKKRYDEEAVRKFREITDLVKNGVLKPRSQENVSTKMWTLKCGEGAKEAENRGISGRV